MNLRSRTAWWVGVPLALVLLVAVLLLLVDVFDRQLIANPLTAAIEEQTGRSLQFEYFDLRWTPLSLHAENISFANADWGQDAPMLQAALASVTINPARLLSGPPYAAIFLEQPVVLVERSAEGELNWNFETDPQPERAPSLPVILHAERGRVVYQDATEAPPAEVEVERLSVETPADSEGAQTVVVALRASNNDIPVAVDTTVAMGVSGFEGEVALRPGESIIAGSFAVDVGTDAVQLRADLTSELLIPEQLAGLLPASSDESAREAITVPRLDGIDAAIAFDVTTVRLPTHMLRDLSAQLNVQQGRVQLEDLRMRLGDVWLQAAASVDTVAPDPVLQLHVDLMPTPLSLLPASIPLSEQPGEAAAEIEARVEMPDRQIPMNSGEWLDRLTTQSRLLYSVDGVDVIADVRVRPAGGSPALNLDVQGIEAPPFSASVSAPPLRELMGSMPYPVELQVATDAAQARVTAQLKEVLREPELRLSFSASGDELPAFPALDFLPPPIPEFSVSGVLRQEAERWSVDDLELNFGESRLTGNAIYDTAGERPALNIDAQAQLLDLTAWPQSDAESTDTDAVPDLEEPWIPDNIAEALNSLDVRAQLAAEQIRFTEDFTVDTAQLSPQLEQGRLRLQPFAFSVAGGEVEGTLVLQGAQSPVDGELSITLNKLRLSQFSDAFTYVEQRLGTLSGQARLHVTEETPAGDTQDLLLPTLGTLVIEDTRLHFENPEAGTELTMTVAADDSAGSAQQLSINVQGTYLGETVQVDLQGESLPALRDPQSPYELSLHLTVAELQAVLEGQLEPPWAPRSADFSFSASAEETVGLQQVIDSLLASQDDSSAVPELAAFALDGTVTYQEPRIEFTAFSAAIGNSDLAGDFSLDMSTDTPAITASLSSNQLDIDDIMRLRGGDSGAPNNEPAADNGEDGEEQAREQLLPQQELNLDLLRRATADIDYSAANINAGGVPLDGATVRIQLDNGHLVAEPLRIGAIDGVVEMRLDLQATDSALEGVFEVEGRSVDLSSILENLEFAANSFGVIGGQGKFWLSGNSVASLVGSADGGLMLLMTGGALDALLVEAAGLDIGESLLVAAGLAETVPIDCAYASVHSTDGMVDIDQFIIDTQDTSFFLEGSLNLVDETLDLTLFPEAKDVGLPAGNSPLDITGTFAQPEVDVFSEDLIARAVQATVIGALAGPVGALLPFMELGLQDEPPICQGWVEQLQEASDDAQ
ncbi:MAG: AsmA family protein [Pseudohongiellaceae bacterium]